MARNANGEITDIWANAGDTAIPPVTFTEGWDITYSQTGGPKPERTSLNFLLKQLYSMGLDISQFGGSLPYSQMIDFEVDAIVTEAGSLFICLLANGPGTAVKIPGAGGSETFWSQLGVSSPGAFESQLLHVRDEKTSGTSAGTFTAGSYVTRVFNTVLTNEIAGASLSSNQVSLPAGTYYFQASAPAFNTNQHKTKLQDITGASPLVIGSSERDDGGAQTRSFCSGRFIIGVTSLIELQHRCTSTNAGNGLGENVAFGDIETYADLKIWKVG